MKTSFAPFAFLMIVVTALRRRPRSAATIRCGRRPIPAAVERGKALYGVNCQFCHGADTRGGDSGPSLLRSAIVLDDQHGELIAPVVRGRPSGHAEVHAAPTIRSPTSPRSSTPSAPPATTSRASSRRASSSATRRPGEAFFTAKCASCHSATGDLRGIATKIADPRLLQQTWLMPGSGGGRGAPPPVQRQADDGHGDAAVGREGRRHARSHRRLRGVADDGRRHAPIVPRPTATRRRSRSTIRCSRTSDLLRTYTDADIHNVTAYLVTLK